MSTYMKTNALNTAFQLLKVIASGKLLQEQKPKRKCISILIKSSF